MIEGSNIEYGNIDYENVNIESGNIEFNFENGNIDSKTGSNGPPVGSNGVIASPIISRGPPHPTGTPF